MRFPEELEEDEKRKDMEPPFPYIVYCGLGWGFVFLVYFLLLAAGYLWIPYFERRLPFTFLILSLWEVLGILTYMRWSLPLGLSGGLMMLYQLLFPWKYPLSDDEKKWLG